MKKSTIALWVLAWITPCLIALASCGRQETSDSENGTSITDETYPPIEDSSSAPVTLDDMVWMTADEAEEVLNEYVLKLFEDMGEDVYWLSADMFEYVYEEDGNHFITLHNSDVRFFYYDDLDEWEVNNQFGSDYPCILFNEGLPAVEERIALYKYLSYDLEHEETFPVWMQTDWREGDTSIKLYTPNFYAEYDVQL